MKTIIEELREKGIMNRGKPFARNTVYYLLSNEKYAGIYRHGDEVFTNIYPRIVPDEIFSIVASKIANNKYGKHKENIFYLLRNKIFCGYCGKPINSDAGTSRNGEVKRYYKCSGKRINKSCPNNPIRKELIEDIIIKTTYEALSHESIVLLADKIVDINKKQNEDDSALKLILNDFIDTEKAIKNILSAMEQGVFTSSTKERLEQLETKKIELSQKIQIEKTKTKLSITKEEIIKYLLTSLKKEPRPMIDALIRKIVLYNNKIEIYYNYVNNKNPDGTDNHRDFIFYACTKTFKITQNILNESTAILSFNIELYM